MNIFFLHDDPILAAELQCDKHVVKMIVESAQMLSTAHRLLDGVPVDRPSKSGKRTVKYWQHPDADMESLLYKSVHMKHPCTVWTMESSQNYKWHYVHFTALCNEYSYRYEKTHSTDTKLRSVLSQLPTNIPKNNGTPVRLAMGSNPECMFPNDPVRSYRAFYKTKRDRFSMVWTKRKTPSWFIENV